jgi:hypothetical protein
MTSYLITNNMSPSVMKLPSGYISIGCPRKEKPRENPQAVHWMFKPIWLVLLGSFNKIANCGARGASVKFF